MIRKIRMFLAKVIFPEIFNTASFWKNRENPDLIGYNTLAQLKQNWEGK